MIKMQNFLEYEEKQLRLNIEMLQKEVLSYPDGVLNIQHSHGTAQYYYFTESSPIQKNGRHKLQYISKKDMGFTEQLAQKKYDTKLLKIFEQRYSAIKRALRIYNLSDPGIVFDEYSDCWKKLIKPRYVSDNDYAKDWQETPYKGKTFLQGESEIYTVKGERVRSKSEKIIADALERKQIPYRYECPLQVEQKMVIYPDFTILNKYSRKEYYLEHLGMMDRADYAEDAVRRIEWYEKQGIYEGDRLILTWETSKNPLNIRVLERKLDYFFNSENIR